MLGNDLNPAWLFVARFGSRLAAVASVRLGEQPGRAELGWCGVTPPFAPHAQSLTLALAAGALQAASHAGVKQIVGEFDRLDPGIMHVYASLPWQVQGTWLTLTTPGGVSLTPRHYTDPR